MVTRQNNKQICAHTKSLRVPTQLWYFEAQTQSSECPMPQLLARGKPLLSKSSGIRDKVRSKIKADKRDITKAKKWGIQLTHETEIIVKQGADATSKPNGRGYD
jgi:hypothetical protein